VVARLLVAAVATVLAMDDHLEPELSGDPDGLVTRHVVQEDVPVDELVRDGRVRPLERPRGVIRGHDDDESGGAGWIERRHARKGTAGGPDRPWDTETSSAYETMPPAAQHQRGHSLRCSNDSSAPRNRIQRWRNASRPASTRRTSSRSSITGPSHTRTLRRGTSRCGAKSTRRSP